MVSWGQEGTAGGQGSVSLFVSNNLRSLDSGVGGGGKVESNPSHHRRQTTQNEKAHDLKVSESPQNLKIF